MKAAPLPARTVAIPALPDGWQCVRYTVLADGALAIVGTDADLLHEWRRGDDGRVLGKPMEVASRASARVWVFDGHDVNAGPTFPLETPFPMVDRFPDGRWLVASSRTEAGENGRVLTAEGEEVRRFRLGDGIMQLKIDDASSIWVGWFDEGVFGNREWRSPNLEWAPSAYGLAAFDDQGQPKRIAEGAPRGSEIADCYALNIVGETAWACTYPDFPISQSQIDSQTRWWRSPLSGPGALAISFPYVVAAGGYGNAADRLSFGKLHSGGFALLHQWRLPWQSGFPNVVDFVDGRGDELHIVHDGHWHIWRMDQFKGLGAR